MKMIKLFCKHEWKMLSETEHESPFLKSRIKNARGLSESVIRGKLIQIVVCDKCGSIKKFVEEI